ncbi:MAG: hypothetical protein QJT81_03675 [Candidatus Thiothrix putei]|uniref:Uncharacterized protein n=1 Tax=Candidatus Thiothrix putei TaxID=3080811 RepID=A0AA95KNH3_9GAMM|nr:MAG: hypothetical protein QJT81_03675 [Candidatus Thiothrix putei]
MLPGIEPSALVMWFDEEPVGVKIGLDPGKLNEAMPRILAALSERLPDDLPTEQTIENKPPFAKGGDGRGKGGAGGGFLLFTTREPLPAPFHHTAREIVLGALSVTDAKALVMQVMNNEGLHLRHDDQGNTPQEVDDLSGLDKFPPSPVIDIDNAIYCRFDS